LKPFDWITKYLKRRKEHEWNLKVRDAWGHTDIPENVRDMNYTVSWDKEFNEAVLHQLKEIPEENRRLHKELEDVSTQAFRRFLKKKQQEEESQK